MADEQDARVTAAYRALGAEEPPRALDEAILAASRRSARSWSQRWAVPLSLAAVVVLSVTVTLRIQHEQPDLTTAQAPAPVAHAPAPEQAQPRPKSEEPPKLPAKKEANRESRRAEPKAFADARADRAPAAGPSAAQASAPPPPAALGELASRSERSRTAETGSGDSALRHAEERAARDTEAASRAPQIGATFAKPRSAPAAEAAARAAPETVAKLSADTPERELERIAQLRAEGKHDEADKALAEFRKRHPDYRIAEDVLRRVERR